MNLPGAILALDNPSGIPSDLESKISAFQSQVCEEEEANAISLPCALLFDFAFAKEKLSLLYRMLKSF